MVVHTYVEVSIEESCVPCSCNADNYSHYRVTRKPTRITETGTLEEQFLAAVGDGQAERPKLSWLEE